MRWLLLSLLLPLSFSLSGKTYPGKLHTRELRRGGFEIVCERDGQEVLLGYSSHGHFDRAIENPGFQLLLKTYEESAVLEQRVGGLSTLSSLGTPSAVEPLLTDIWDQFEPYNAFTPCIGEKHCAVGCVALAMAQVLRYWKAQPHADEYTYTDSLGCKQTLTVHFPSSYDYANMLDSYVEGHYTEAQLTAVARLLADCGIAVDMRYGISSSGANTIRQAQALREFFSFSPSLQHYYRDFYTTAEWNEMLRTELAEGRPILMAAQSPSLAHAFVCDGYDEQGLYHLNLGMGGDADGYYYLPHLTPKQPEWYDLDSPEGGMNLLQYAILGAEPSFSTAEVPHYTFAFAGMEVVEGRASREGALSLASQNLSNVGWNEHEGEVALLLKKGEEVMEVLARYNHGFLLEEVEDTSYTDTLTFSVPSHVSDGTYRVVPAFQQPVAPASPQTLVWEEARTSVGTPNYLLLHVSPEGVVLYQDTLRTASLTLEDYSFPDTIVRSSKPEFSFTIKNNLSAYNGRFFVTLEPVGKEGTYRYIQYEGLSLEPGETTRRYFHRTSVPVAEGDYNLYLFYDQNLFNDSLLSVSEEPLKVVHVVGANGIQSVEDAAAVGASCVDLQGRPLARPPKHEVYIEQKKDKSKKIFVK